MAVDKDIRYKVTADEAGFAAALARVKSQLGDVDGKVGGLFSGLTSQFGKLSGLVGALSGLLAGGLFKASVDATKDFTLESNKLARVLGVTATEASTLNVALGDIYADSETFTSASAKLAKQLRDNEAALNHLGLRTREANGEYRSLKDLMLDSIQVVNGYKQGTDRNLASTVAWGKGAEEAAALLKLNNQVLDEARAKQEALGLVVGVENVAALARFRAMQNDVGDMLLALKKVIGDALMPVLTKLGEWFTLIGPAAVTILKGALGGLVSVFWALKNGITVVWEVLNALVVSLGESIRVLFEALGRAATGDFSGAVNVLRAGSANIKAAWAQAMDEMLKSSEETATRISELFGKATPIAATPSGGKGYRNAPDPAKPSPSSYMAYYEALLAEEKRVNAVLTQGREFTKEQEAEFWRWLLQTAQLTAADRVNVLRKIAEAEVAIATKARKDREAIERDDADAAGALALGKLAAEQEAARDLVAMGRITHEQLLALELGYEDQRYQIKRAALQARLALLERDPEMNAVEMRRIKNDLLLLEQEYERAKAAGQRALQLEQGKPQDNVWAAAEQQINTATQNIINRTNTLRGALVGIWAGIRQAIVAELAKIVAQKVIAFAKERAIALASIQTDAARAGAGAAASQAGIPFVGPFLAIAAMAAIMMAVRGQASSVPSAAQGWRVPAGVNPLTQLHEQEMVLDKKHAQVIDDLANAGGTGGPQVVLNVQRWGSNHFIAEIDKFAEAFGFAKRNFIIK